MTHYTRYQMATVLLCFCFALFQCGCNWVDDSYYRSVTKWAAEVLDANEQMFPPDEVIAEMRAGLEKLRKAGPKGIESPLVLWHEINHYPEEDYHVLRVNWVCNRPVGDIVNVRLKTGGVITFRVHEDYQDYNRTLHANGEGMYATLLLMTDEMVLLISDEDISDITVEVASEGDSR